MWETHFVFQFWHIKFWGKNSPNYSESINILKSKIAGQSIERFDFYSHLKIWDFQDKACQNSNFQMAIEPKPIYGLPCKFRLKDIIAYQIIWWIFFFKILYTKIEIQNVSPT